ncbi:aromatic-ring-hydroxylating dioxygenase subunit beta [Gordonia sp. NPDC003376]
MTTVTTSTNDPRLQRAIDLIWHEADLLDHAAYEEWQRLYSADGLYIIPIDRDGSDFENTLNMVYDDATMRKSRVARMTEGYAIAAVDAARTVRTVSRFVPVDVADDEVTVRAAQILVAYKRRSHDLWAAEVTHTVRLTPGSGSDLIVRKVIRLIDSDDVVPAAGFLL